MAAGGDRASRVPERDRVLDGLGRQRDRREVVVLRALAADLTRREGVADDAEDVDEPLPRLGPAAAEPVVLDRCDTPTDAEVESPVRQVVDHAHVLDDLHRMVQRQQLHHRPEADVLRDLRRGRDEHLLVRRHAEIRPVVLGEVEPGEARFVGLLDQIESISQQLRRRRAGDVLDVIEDAERWPAHRLPQSPRRPEPRRARACHVVRPRVERRSDGRPGTGIEQDLD